MRVRTRSRGARTALRSPAGKKRGSSARQMRSTPKKIAAVTNMPPTNVMPNICRSADSRLKPPGQQRPQDAPEHARQHPAAEREHRHERGHQQRAAPRHGIVLARRCRGGPLAAGAHPAAARDASGNRQQRKGEREEHKLGAAHRDAARDGIDLVEIRRSGPLHPNCPAP